MSGPIKGYLTRSGGPGQGDSVTVTQLAGGKIGLDVAVSGAVEGSFSPIGLSQGIRTTKVTVTDAATLIPLNAYASRNTLLVRVGGAEKVYIGNSGVSVAGVETPALSGNFVGAGFPFFQFEQFAVDVIAGTSTEIYGICEAGKSSFVWIIEVG